MTPSALPLPTDIELFFDGDSFFESVLSLIEQAREEILLETYIFDIDPIGELFLKALAAARRRRVAVNLMVDGVGSSSTIEKLYQFSDKNHIEFRVFHPPLFFSRFSHAGQNLTWTRWLRAWVVRLQSAFVYVNKRDHRKMVIIDGHTAFLGSLNITAVHSRKFRGPEAWRDSGARVKADTDLFPLISAFQKTWLRSRDLDRPRFSFKRRIPLRYKAPLPRLFRLNDSFRRRFQSGRDLRRRIRQAHTRILITNAYFLPRPSFLRSLRAAARRGVFVGLCLPSKTDVWMVREAGRTMMRKLINDGVQVFEYQPSILHAKTMVIDDWGLVGSHNLNYRSFIHDLEVDLILSEAKPIQRLTQQWDADLRQSHALTLKDLDQDSWRRRLVGRLVYLVRYWM